MPTAKESLAKIEAHEKECAVRYTNIEKRLDKGDVKFDALDAKFTRYRFIYTYYWFEWCR